MDCSILPIHSSSDLFIVSTTDFFYPLIQNPYTMGMIACANVLSDLYAVGIIHIDSILMLLAASTAMDPELRSKVTAHIVNGFCDLARSACARVTGGQSVMNPWPIIGGVAMSVVRESEIIRPENAIPGDVIVLTKPLGIQLAVNVFEWFLRDKAKFETLNGIIDENDAFRAYAVAEASMMRLNLTAAKLMHKYHAHAATDVTGFGILGHAKNLAKNQKVNVDLILDVLPLIRGMGRVNEVRNFKLMDGYAAETSGGLLICMHENDAIEFMKEIENIDGWPAWIIGRVVDGNGSAMISPDVKVIEV